MKWKNKNLRALADIVCGNVDHFRYRSSSYITEFFEDCGLEYIHDGTTRWAWVASRLEEVLALPHSGPSVPPDAFVRIIRCVLDKGEAQEGDEDRGKALDALNKVLASEGWEAFYDEHGIGQLRHIATNTIAQIANPHRPLTPSELERKNQLITYLDKCSEDQLIEEVLLPLFRQLGFHRVTAVGHKDKVLEYGKDVWMKFTLPTLHVLYFGVQAKKGKLDAAGMSKGGASNIGEMLNQVTMMLGHEIFDPETNRRVLVDHAFIVAGGGITKQAKNWLGERLDVTKRSQVSSWTETTYSTCSSLRTCRCRRGRYLQQRHGTTLTTTYRSEHRLPLPSPRPRWYPLARRFVMLKSTSVALDEHLVGFIDRQIAEGRYGSAIEVVRAALGVAGRKRGEARGVAGALIEGEQSGPSEAFDFDAFIAARRSADR